MKIISIGYLPFGSHSVDNLVQQNQSFSASGTLGVCHFSQAGMEPMRNTTFSDIKAFCWLLCYVRTCFHSPSHDLSEGKERESEGEERYIAVWETIYCRIKLYRSCRHTFNKYSTNIKLHSCVICTHVLMTCWLPNATILLLWFLASSFFLDFIQLVNINKSDMTYKQCLPIYIYCTRYIRY